MTTRHFTAAGADGLRLADFGRLPSPPFNSAIRISQATAWYRGRLLVGGGRGPLRAAGGRRGGGAAAPTMGAELASFDPVAGVWRKVWTSPVVTSGGLPHARDRSVRAAAVFQGVGDNEPTLYLALGSLSDQVVLLRSVDGEHFDACGAPGLGLGDTDVAAVRTLCPWNGRLYTSPIGKNRGRGMADDNESALPVVLASDTPRSGCWEVVSEPGFGNADNLAVNEMAVFAGHLYAATVNRRNGFELWKAVDTGCRPYRWERIISHGAWRGPANPLPTAMQVFGDALYIGTGLQRQGRGGADSFGPIAPELIRVYADDNWEIIVGEARTTPDGLKRPLSGAGAGFGDPFCHAFWRMAEYEGRLYLGASDWRCWPSYLPRGQRTRPDLLPAELERLQTETAAWRGEYGMWSSIDGVAWEPVTSTGLGGGAAQYGIRELLATPAGLVAVPAATEGGSGGGVEVYCGRRGA